MATSNKFRQCKQSPLCKVAIDGKCIEGLGLDVCPHIYFTESSSQEGKAENTEPTSKDPGIKLLSGEELKLEDLHVITNKYQSKRIFIIGESDSGKTTLLVRLYNSFQMGPFSNYLFAGSLSLIGFERRCHLSKIESNGDKEQTEKTKSKDFSFLHIALKQKGVHNSQKKHFLISDISGERIRLARNASVEMKELTLLQNSARILVIIDGAKIADQKYRLSALMHCQTFIRQALDDKILKREHKVGVILSKWDLLHNRQDFNFERDIIGPFRSAFQERIDDLKFFQIAARPENPMEIQPGYGLPDLLDDWFKDDKTSVNRTEFNSSIESDRSINKFRAVK